MIEFPPDFGLTLEAIMKDNIRFGFEFWHFEGDLKASFEIDSFENR
jgi:hypothetical protein